MKFLSRRVTAVVRVCGDRAAAAASEGTGAAAPVAPRLLSQTGLYSDVAALKVDDRNRSFSPQYPLWSDGATKRRWVRLPAGSKINVADPGRWELPVGTKFWKEFVVQRPQGRDALPVADGQEHVDLCLLRLERCADRRGAGVCERRRRRGGRCRRQAPQHPVSE